MDVEPEPPVTPVVSLTVTLKDLEVHKDVLENLMLLGWEDGEIQNDLLSPVSTQKKWFLAADWFTKVFNLFVFRT